MTNKDRFAQCDTDLSRLQKALKEMGRNVAASATTEGAPQPFYRSVIARAIATKRKGKGPRLILTEADLELADFVVERLKNAGFCIVVRAPDLKRWGDRTDDHPSETGA